jgi:nitroreductase
MRRSFTGDPLDEHAVRDDCELALRAPTAGNSAGVRMTVLTQDLVGRFFEAATDETWRATAVATRLKGAGAAVVVTARPQDYVARYSEPDKSDPLLRDALTWPLPYWHADAAMATMALLLLSEERGWGAAFWGAFRNAREVLHLVGREDEELFGTVLLGRPSPNDLRSSSLRRGVPAPEARVSVLGAD